MTALPVEALTDIVVCTIHVAGHRACQCSWRRGVRAYAPIRGLQGMTHVHGATERPGRALKIPVMCYQSSLKKSVGVMAALKEERKAVSEGRRRNTPKLFKGIRYLSIIMGIGTIGSFYDTELHWRALCTGPDGFLENRTQDGPQSSI